MKTKRILSLLMAGALLTGALTGCGSKKDDSAQSGDNSGVITINYPTVNLSVALSATALIIGAGVLAGYFPARKAVKITAIEAMRNE